MQPATCRYANYLHTKPHLSAHVYRNRLTIRENILDLNYNNLEQRKQSLFDKRDNTSINLLGNIYWQIILCIYLV